MNTAALALLGSSYGLQPTVSRTLTDGNGDGVVNVADHTVWRDELASPATVVPEPATLGIVPVILALLFAGEVRRSHR